MSVASNLAALGALMKTNLEAKGVTGLTSDMGLTTLANKILDIPSGGPSTTLSLTGSSPIISSGETCSLSGLLTSNGQAVGDELILFYNDEDKDPLAIGDSCDNFIFKADAEAGNGHINLSTPQLYSLSIYWHESNRGNYFYMIYDANDQLNVASPQLHGDILYRMGDTFITNGGDSFTLPSAYSSYFIVDKISYADEFHPIIGAGFTDSLGTVSVDYEGTGFGDVTVVAEATVNGTFLQETYEIQDMVYIWDCLSDDGKWDWNSNMAHTYSSNGLTFYRSSGAGDICSKSTVTLPIDFEVEFTYMGGVLYSVDSNWGGAGITHDINNHRTWYYYRECTNQNSSTVVTVNETVSSGDVFKIRRENGVISIYRNDVLKHSFTAPNPNYDYMELVGYNSARNTTIKDIKVKAV